MNEQANTERGELALELGGKKYVLIPAFSRIKRVESLLKMTFVEIAVAAGNRQRLSFEEMANLIGALSVPKETNYDEDVIGEAIIQEGIINVFPKIAPIFETVLTGGKKVAEAKTD